MKILVTGTRVYVGGEVYEGYLFIDGSRVAGRGEGEPPEEYQWADLVVGGPNRLAIVGLSTLPASLETIAYRSRLYTHSFHSFLSSKEAGWIASTLSEEHAYYSALLSVYELVAGGYSFIVSADPHALAVARALRDTGVHGAVLVPFDCQYSPSSPEAVVEELAGNGAGGVEAGIYTCSPERAPELSESYTGLPVLSFKSSGLVVARKGEEAVIGPASVVEKAAVGPMRVLSAFTALTITVVEGMSVAGGLGLLTSLYTLLGNGKADVTVVEAEEPPCHPMSLENLAGCSPRIETLVSNGTLLVDTGQAIMFSVDELRKAAQVVKELAKKHTQP